MRTQSNAARLQARSIRRHRGDKQQRVFLRADKTVPDGELMALMNELRSAGYLRVALVALKRQAMNATRDMAVVRRWPESARWVACFVLAAGFHVAGAAALLARWNDASDLVANAPVITIELAALPVAPETTPNEYPPAHSNKTPNRRLSPISRSKRNWSFHRIRKPSLCRPLCHRRKRSKNPARKSPNKSTRVLPALRAPPTPNQSEPPRRQPVPTRKTRTPCRTGSRSSSHNSNEASATRRRHNRAASKALRSSPSASTEAAAFTMRVSRAAQAEPARPGNAGVGCARRTTAAAAAGDYRQSNSDLGPIHYNMR